MKVVVTRPHLGPNNRVVEPGEVMEVSDSRGREMVRVNIGVPLLGRDLPKGAASKGSERPIQPPPSGGPTGEAKPVLLSPQVQAPKKRTYNRRGAKPE